MTSAAGPRHGAGEVFAVFLRLGLTSFGGPVAHLAYFRDEFVARRRWLGERAYADLVALCQFLPGPASSQVGFALGLSRAGLPGALAAWAGFTLPSALALIVLALGLAQAGDALPAGVLHGLKLAAVAVVAQAVWGMARALCVGPVRATLMVAAAGVVLWVPGGGRAVRRARSGGRDRLVASASAPAVGGRRDRSHYGGVPQPCADALGSGGRIFLFPRGGGFGTCGRVVLLRGGSDGPG